MSLCSGAHGQPLTLSGTWATKPDPGGTKPGATALHRVCVCVCVGGGSTLTLDTHAGPPRGEGGGICQHYFSRSMIEKICKDTETLTCHP